MKTKRRIFFLAAAFASLAFPLISNAAQAAGGLTVKDSLDRTVVIPTRARRVVAIQAEISRLIVALGAGDDLVGIDYTLRLHDHLFKYIYPKQSGLPLVSMAENNVNLETIMALEPDIIFVSPYERQIVDAIQRKTRIPVVALASMGSLAKLAEEMRLVGRILGREERAEELVSFFNGTLDRIRERLKDVPSDQKPRVYMTFWGSLTRTPVSYEPVNVAGGVNVSEKIIPTILGSVGTVVKIEQILLWNPDMILVHGNYPPKDRAVTVEGILKDPRLTALSSVKSKKVFYTFGFWEWWDMAEVTLETMYLAHLFHPDKFPEFDLKKEGAAVFKKFYGLDDGFARISRILGCDEWSHE